MTYKELVKQKLFEDWDVENFHATPAPGINPDSEEFYKDLYEAFLALENGDYEDMD